MANTPDLGENIAISSSASVVTDGQAAPQSREARSRKKTSTACSVCKKRKTKCSGEYPCDRCIQRGTVADCVIDSNADLRRRGATERRTEEVESDRRLLDGILETIRSGTDDQVQSLYDLIRDNTPRSFLLSHVDRVSQGSVFSDSGAAESSQPASPQNERRSSKSDSQHRPTGSIHDLLNHDQTVYEHREA